MGVARHSGRLTILDKSIAGAGADALIRPAHVDIPAVAVRNNDAR